MVLVGCIMTFRQVGLEEDEDEERTAGRTDATTDAPPLP